VLLAYLDESYDRDQYWIAALICREEEVVPLTAALDEVVEDAAEGFRGISERAELHGYCLFHGEDDWESLEPMPRARIGVYNAAFGAIGASNVRIIIRGVNRRRLEERYFYPDHPHSVVLSHLLERIDELAASEDELALIIADEVDQADAYRRNLWMFQRYSTTGYRARQLTRIIDTLHFAPSTSSRLVQAADLVAFMHQRITSNADQDDRARRANAAIWKRIRGNVEHIWRWEP